jgi:pyruvate ferredoxin oxidoreductase alpha subunit
VLAAAGAAAAAGARVFTATSSQGLLYGMEMLYNISGWRVPLVLVNVSRALAAPITLEPDHNDVLAARDSGFLQIHAETCQEVLDSILMAYAIAEDERVLLPAIVNLDGFHLSFTREPVEIPSSGEAAAFLPPYRPRHAFFRAGEPMAQGAAVMGGAAYSFFRYQAHLASLNALEAHEEAAERFAGLFGRRYGALERYRMEDAETALVMSNSYASRGRALVDALRQEGLRAGLVRLRLIRPFPSRAVAEALAGLECAVVVDQNLAPGKGGAFYGEVAEALYHSPGRPAALLSAVGGLGGKELRPGELRYAVERASDAARRRSRPEPLLLMTEEELELVLQQAESAGRMGEARGVSSATR